MFTRKTRNDDDEIASKNVTIIQDFLFVDLASINNITDLRVVHN